MKEYYTSDPIFWYILLVGFLAGVVIAIIIKKRS